MPQAAPSLADAERDLRGILEPGPGEVRLRLQTPAGQARTVEGHGLDHGGDLLLQQSRVIPVPVGRGKDLTPPPVAAKPLTGTQRVFGRLWQQRMSEGELTGLRVVLLHPDRERHAHGGIEPFLGPAVRSSEEPVLEVCLSDRRELEQAQRLRVQPPHGDRHRTLSRRIEVVAPGWPRVAR
jgi:hypothetical protein